MNSFYPLCFKPQLQYRLWGGEKLKTFLNKDYSSKKQGESWELSSLKGFESIVAEGFHLGKSLNDLINKYPSAILGDKVLSLYGKNFPLLIKFIDAKIPLSVQVHPNDRIAKKRHNSFGKNEMWYILDAKPDAHIILGLKKEVSREEFKKLLANDHINKILHYEKVTAGDIIYIPSGQIHAIGGGVLLAEIQQSSNITYRVYDYNRIDEKTGKTRELHNDLAIDTINFTSDKKHKIVYRKEVNKANLVLDTPDFKTVFVVCDGMIHRSFENRGSFTILISLNGNMKVNFDNVTYEFPLGKTILIPAIIKKIVLKGKGTFLETYI